MKRCASLAVGAVAVVTAGGLLVGVSGSAAAAGTSPPWEPDGNSVGGLTFFNAAGQQIDGGSVSDAPIAAYVEGATAQRSTDTKATLYGYLPKSTQTPPAFSGEVLGGPTAYPNAAAPSGIAGATQPVYSGASGDESIANLIADFPNTDTTNDGYANLYQLRLRESGTPGGGQLIGYNSADIQISGSGATATWSVVYPTPTLSATGTTLTTTQTSPQEAGTSITLNAAVSPAVPGTVQFLDGSANIGSPVTVSGGAASISDSTLGVGPHTLHAVFTPAANYAYDGSTGDDSFEITRPPATATTTDLGVDPTTAPAFSDVTLSATVATEGDGTPLTSGDGSVEFFDNGTDSLGSVPLGSNGVAELPYSDLAVGSHSITAQFEPTDSTVYATSFSSAVSQTSTPALTTTAASADNDSVVAGQSVTFTADVAVANPDSDQAVAPGGTVAFLSGSQPVVGCGETPVSGSGEAQCTVPAGFSVSSQTISAQYSGDSNFAGSTSSTFPLSVTQDSTSTAVVASSNPATPGTNVVYTATVTPVGPGSGVPTGTVNFTVTGPAGTTPSCSGGNTGTLSNGMAACTVPASSLVAGASYAVTATYGGNSDFATSVGSLSQTVSMGAAKVAVSSSTNPAQANGPVTLTATVSPVAPAFGKPTGTITFSIVPSHGQVVTCRSADTVTLSHASMAKCVAESDELLAVNSPYVVTASYSGDASFTPAVKTLNQRVRKATTTTTITASPAVSKTDQAVTFTAKVTASHGFSSALRGAVSFKVTGTKGGAVKCAGGGEVGSGISFCTVAHNKLSAKDGPFKVIASYTGDSEDGASKASVSHRVTK